VAGIRWSEYDLLRYQARGGKVVEASPHPRLYATLAELLDCSPATATIYLDNLATCTESNTGGHWAPKATRAKMQRQATFTWLTQLLPPVAYFAPPLTITLTRVAPRLLDVDGAVSALKHIQDGVADYLAGAYGAGQDRQAGLAWAYGQHRGAPRRYGVLIRLAHNEGSDE
jgi:hypothetical protein